MGVNMPAKTVIFSQLDKFDGSIKRIVSGSEFIQMAGRAGRRGKDDVGRTITILNSKLSEQDLKQLTIGNVEPLNSSFQITYSTILKMLKQEGYNPEIVIKKSFLQHQRESSKPEIKQKIKKIKDELFKLTKDKELIKY